MWIVYILECYDHRKSLYTGITNNLEKRLKAHFNNTGAKFTRGKGPFKVLATWTFSTKSEALKMEAKIKKLSRSKKLELINDQ